MPIVPTPTIDQIMGAEMFSYEERVDIAFSYGYTEQEIIDAGYSV
jgi:hypothetical protein|tara:strand:+ start:1973 stop:2107 length:135 start_codon:yes stop_codon:yes gene_type:complete